MPDHETEAVSHGSDADVLADVALAAADPSPLDPSVLYHVVLPRGGRGEVIDLTSKLQAHLAAPKRARGTVVLDTVDSLTAYVTRHSDPEHTTVWVHERQGRIEAVINDHAPDAAAWGDHRAVLSLQPTPEWQHWTAHDTKLLSQVAFAEHIEDGMAEIVEPDGATMLELAQSIQATTEASFRSATRLSDGQVGFRYDEETTATAGRSGQLEIPQTFELGLAPYVGEDRYTLRARLRYRVGSGNLTIGYRLDRPHEITRDAIAQIAQRLAETFPSVYLGTPRS